MPLGLRVLAAAVAFALALGQSSDWPLQSLQATIDVASAKDGGNAGGNGNGGGNGQGNSGSGSGQVNGTQQYRHQQR